MAHDVLISHSAKDKTAADAVCAMLESKAIRCWIAPRDVLPGVEWGECIIEAIEGSRVMVLIFTANANASPQIRREVERAVSHGVAILPLRIDDILPARALEYFIGNVHWLDALTPPLETHLDNLAVTVKMLLARMPLQTAPQPEVPQPQPEPPQAQPEPQPLQPQPPAPPRSEADASDAEEPPQRTIFSDQPEAKSRWRGAALGGVALLIVAWLTVQFVWKRDTPVVQPPARETPGAAAPAPTVASPLPAAPAPEGAPVAAADPREEPIRALLNTWVDSFKQKDLARQVDCYAPVIETYFLRHNVSRDVVRTDKDGAFRNITEIRDFNIQDVTFSTLTDAGATVRLQKTWDTTSPTGKTYAGQEIEELQFALADGRWGITVEKEIKVLWVKRG